MEDKNDFSEKERLIEVKKDFSAELRLIEDKKRLRCR